MLPPSVAIQPLLLPEGPMQLEPPLEGPASSCVCPGSVHPSLVPRGPSLVPPSAGLSWPVPQGAPLVYLRIPLPASAQGATSGSSSSYDELDLAVSKPGARLQYCKRPFGR